MFCLTTDLHEVLITFSGLCKELCSPRTSDPYVDVVNLASQAQGTTFSKTNMLLIISYVYRDKAF